MFIGLSTMTTDDGHTGSSTVRAVIFDVDGTLIDSVDAHAHAWQEAFRLHGFEIAFDRLRGQIGKGGDQLLPVFLDEDQIDKFGEALDADRGRILKERYLDTIQAFPETRALFVALDARGIAVALASSAKDDELDVYKQKAKVDDLIDKQTSSDDAERSKPHGDIFEAALGRLKGIAASEAIVIGDTPYDAEAAGKVGLRTIGVLCGGFPERDLRGAGAIAIYRDPADLLANLEAVLQVR